MTPAELADEKKFYERFWALHSNSDLVKAYARFGYHTFRRSSVLEGFGPFIAAHAFKGKCCVEIGTCKGLTAISLARYFDEVVTVDVVADHEKREIADYLGITNVRFVDVKDNGGKADLITSLDFDAAYVDGDHAHDTQFDFDLVRRCGRVLFHEYWEAQPPVWNLVNELKSNGGHVVTSGKLALWTI